MTDPTIVSEHCQGQLIIAEGSRGKCLIFVFFTRSINVVRSANGKVSSIGTYIYLGTDDAFPVN